MIERWRRAPTALLLAVVVSACTAAGRPAAGPPPGAQGGPAFLEERALLLLLEDRRVFEPGILQSFLGRQPEVREMLAVALGRIGDPAARPMLGVLAGDASPAVRRAAVFALGEIGDAAGSAALVRALSDDDRETGGLAVEALGKAGRPLAEVTSRLAALPEAERGARLLPFLFRFKEPGIVPVAVAGLSSQDPALHAAAAYALGRDAQAGGLAALRGLVVDPEPWVRGIAARGLGAVGDAEDAARLRSLLDDPAPGPVVQALRAARKLVQAGRLAAPAEWTPRLRELIDDPRPGVSLTAIEASASWLPAALLGDRLAQLALQETGRPRELAIGALVEGKDPRAAQAVALAARAAEPTLRARAAEAAGALADEEVLQLLAADPDPGVRAAVLSARLGGSDAEPSVREALSDGDAIVRATALDWLAEHPALPLDALQEALRQGESDSLPDAALAGARAVAARAKAQALERGRGVELLEELARHSDFLVRREAAARLEALGRPSPPVGAATRRELAVYRDVVRETAAPRSVEIVTRRGRLRVSLDCPRAPLTCLNFLQLARQGYFDGLTFHRVVPDFVVQGGDPRGDGSGGPGYSIRDEINRLRYRRGVLGMALSGPDTGGSQFFITLSAQPHLDGGYTAFGEVIGGGEVLDDIVQGDRIVSVEVIP